ncbi:hypothetical protein Bhyg_11957 [Pseudolycoriella hygida]|uniref:Uncharacterized protein n=1 Tax=Pseudolycoriella hygida TaxID=35572 RepID=A0A9Q0MY40_9DIPT|nr:hypothetical protein Bhyg_11957 [Pseudolycoriella hygida]
MCSQLKTYCVTVCLLLIGVNCFDEWEANNSDIEIEAPCIFDNDDAGRTCNCGFRNEKMYLPQMDGSIFQIRILNCKHLRIKSGTFSRLSILSRVSFTNVEDLILETYSLDFPVRSPSNRVRLDFSNTIIEEIPSYTINGNVDVIAFDNCRIGAIRAFAINGLVDKAFGLYIRNSIIKRIHGQGLKKFTVEQFVVDNVTFSLPIPSRAFYDITVDGLCSITNSNFTTIFSGAFIFQEMNSFRLQGNFIEELSGASFQMPVKESIIIQDNKVLSLSSTAFRAINLHSTYFNHHSEPMEFAFISNTIDIPDVSFTLEFDSRFRMKITKIYFLNPISCAGAEVLSHSAFIIENGDSLLFKVDDSTVTEDSNDYFAFTHIFSHLCIKASYLLYIIIGIVVLIVLAVIIAVIVTVLVLKKRRKRQLNVVMPEGKTYRETQIVMQIEHAGLLKTDL